MVKISRWGSIIHRVLIDTLLVSVIGCVLCFTWKIQTFSPSMSQGVLNIAGNDYEQKKMGNNLSKIVENIEGATKQANACLESVNNILGDKEDQRRIRNNILEMTENTNKCLSSLNKILDNTESGVGSGKENDIAGLIDKLNTCMDSINKTVGSESNLARMSKDAAETMSNIRDSVKAFKEGTRKFGGMGLRAGVPFDYSEKEGNQSK